MDFLDRLANYVRYATSYTLRKGCRILSKIFLVVVEFKRNLRCIWCSEWFFRFLYLSCSIIPISLGVHQCSNSQNSVQCLARNSSHSIYLFTFVKDLSKHKSGFFMITELIKWDHWFELYWLFSLHHPWARALIFNFQRFLDFGPQCSTQVVSSLLLIFVKYCGWERVKRVAVTIEIEIVRLDRNFDLYWKKVILPPISFARSNKFEEYRNEGLFHKSVSLIRRSNKN